MPAHYTTPTKARLLGTAAYLENHGIQYHKSDLFKEFGIQSKSRGWVILHDGLDRRHPAIETRGRKPIISSADLLRMEQILWQYGFAARRLSWQALANEAGIKASPRTVERAMGTLHYRKCIACEKGWVSSSNAERRVRDAERALQFRPNAADWRDIRWSDECHFTICSEGKVRSQANGIAPIVFITSRRKKMPILLNGTMFGLLLATILSQKSTFTKYQPIPTVK